LTPSLTKNTQLDGKHTSVVFSKKTRCPLFPDRSELEIFDVSGKLIKEIVTSTSQSRNDGKIEISLKGINPGIYFLILGKETKKFLVVR